jgi:hypothetical protein
MSSEMIRATIWGRKCSTSLWILIILRILVILSSVCFRLMLTESYRESAEIRALCARRTLEEFGVKVWVASSSKLKYDLVNRSEFQHRLTRIYQTCLKSSLSLILGNIESEVWFDSNSVNLVFALFSMLKFIYIMYIPKWYFTYFIATI